jgi:L-ascorbate oxidase
VTEQEFTQSCITKSNVILVNGTSPGPEIRLAEGNVYWIRVFNDMEQNNVTMVSHFAFLKSLELSDGVALARLEHGCISIQ